MTTNLLPQNIQRELEARFGEIIALEPLGGKSGAFVQRAQCVQQAVILKRGVSGIEVQFYRQIAPTLRKRDIPLPEVYGIFEDGQNWLILEAIPHPLPRERWGSATVLQVIARLHTIESLNDFSGFDHYLPTWTDELTAKALAQFDTQTADALRPHLHECRDAAQSLFHPEAFISCDPNPNNWGLREDGSVVLFDWERWTFANPAIDLAIVIGGLGTLEQFETVAHTYSEIREAMRQPLAIPVEVLTKQIALAKLWAIVEFLSFYSDGQLAIDSTHRYLIEQIPRWIAETFATPTR